MSDKALDVPELAARLMVRPQTVEWWIALELLEAASRNGHSVVDPDQLDRFLKRRQVRRCWVGLQCVTCGSGVEVRADAVGAATGCRSRDCPNRLTSNDLCEVLLAIRVASAGHEDGALAILNRWSAATAADGRCWKATLCVPPTEASQRAASDAMASSGPTPDFRATDECERDLALRLWEPEDAFFDTWEPPEVLPSR